MSRVLGVIPARMGSSRFPGKPLALLCGRPMLEHVYRRAAACSQLSELVIATCDIEIVDAARRFGAKAVMTSPLHERATDRVAEAAAADPADIVVMVQGDEPLIEPSMIADATRSLLDHSEVGCVNLAARIRTEAELVDANTIKVVMGRDDCALYFSRTPIPSPTCQPFDTGEWFKQVCVVPFRRAALQRFAALPQGALERAESIDMLRLLENGFPVRLVRTNVATHAVDTPDDLRLVSLLMSEGSSLSRAEGG